MEGMLVSFNDASANKGGGVFIDDGSVLNATKSLITNNTAFRGAGLLVQSDSGSKRRSWLRLSHGVRVLGNLASSYGTVRGDWNVVIEMSDGVEVAENWVGIHFGGVYAGKRFEKSAPFDNSIH